MFKKFNIALNLAVIVSLLITSLALADDIYADGDGISPVTQHPLSIGNICAGETKSLTVVLAINRNGGANSGKVFKNSSTVTVTIDEWGGKGLSAIMVDSSIILPSDWVSAGKTSAYVSATVTLDTATLQPGTYEGFVYFKGDGINTVDQSFFVLDRLPVGANIVDCAPTSDTTPPVIIPTIDGTLGNNGWYVSDVVVRWIVIELESTPPDPCDPTTISTDTAGQIVTCSLTSDGGTSEESVTIKRDATKPTIVGAPDREANLEGWYNEDVIVSFVCDDNLSGVASCGPDSTLEDEGAGQSVSGYVEDNAGNTAETAVSGINIDKTAPVVNLVGGPADGGKYYFGFVPAAPTCSASDVLSGLDGNCVVSDYGTSLGFQTVKASAKDKAGNEATDKATYEVLAWTLSGFYNPVDNNGVWNTVKGGSTVPFKFEIFAGPTELRNVAYVIGFTAQNVACPVTGFTSDEIEVTATGGTSLRYDISGDQFVFNWQTPKKAGSCYKVTMTTLDGSTLSANFKLK